MSAVRLRGLGPSLGAAGSLAAAAAVMTLLVVGPRVWPSGPGSAGGGSLRMPPVPARKVASPVPTTVATPTLSAPDPRPAATPMHRRATRALPHRHPGRAPAPAATPLAPTATTPPPGKSVSAATPVPTASAVAATPSASSSPAPATRTTPVATATPGAVERTVTAVRQVVEPVVTVLPAPLQAPVATVVGTVEKTAQTVDQTLNGVLGTG